MVKKSALADPASMILSDPAKAGLAEKDPAWRELIRQPGGSPAPQKGAVRAHSDGLSAVEAVLGFSVGERIEACRPPHGKLAPGPCPHLIHKLKRHRSRAIAHAPGVSDAGAPREASYSGPRFRLPPGLARDWDGGVAAAVNAYSPDPTIAPAARGAARRAADAFRERLSGLQRRRFDQEVSIAGRQADWRRQAPPVNGHTDSVGRSREQMRQSLRRLWAGKPIVVPVDGPQLDRVLGEGRFGSGREGLEGLESQLFGPGAGRPVYGYVAVHGLRRGAGPVGAAPVQVVLRDSVRRRTTASMGDSLGAQESVRPSPVTAPEHWSFQVDGQPPGQYRVDPDKFARGQYVEAQIHGDVSADDIAEIIYSRPPDAAQTARLDQKGIQWRVAS